MPDQNAKIDQNNKPTLTAVTDDANQYITRLLVDPATGRLLVSAVGASGTVTSVSVVTANGISGSVATATSTPAITLTLGAITPTSVNGLTLASQAIGFTIAGGTTSKTLTVPLDASVSGTNTGDQNLSGYAPIASPTFTGTPTLPTGTIAVTQTANDNSTKIATTAYADLKAPSTSPTFATSVTGSYLTASQILITGASKEIISAPVATYPSLTELTYVKGVTSAIQTQINTLATKTGSNWTFASQAIGDIAYATSTTAYGRLADVAVGSVLISGGVGTAPSWSANPYITTLELGAATDTTISRVSAGVIAVEGVTIPTISSTSTLTNKRITARVYSTTTLSTLTPEKDTYDIFTLTAQSGTLTIANKSTTTYADGDQIRIRIYCPTTIGAITFGTDYVAKGGNPLPTTTILTKNMEMGFEYNASLGKMNLIALAIEA